jgi:hypothetical protein
MLLSQKLIPRLDKKKLPERRKRIKIDSPKKRLLMISLLPKELPLILLLKLLRKHIKLRWKQESMLKLKLDLHFLRDIMLNLRNKLPTPLKNRRTHSKPKMKRKLKNVNLKRMRLTNRQLKLLLNNKKNKRLQKLKERKPKMMKKPLLWPKSLKQRN